MRALLTTLLLLITCVPGAAQNSNPPRATQAVAVGIGLDGGLVGLKYARRFTGAPLDASLGLGLAGIAPAAAWRAIEWGGWSAYAGGGVLYSPFETPLTSPGTALGFAALGTQYWPRGARGIYLSMAAEPAVVLRGGTEGSSRPGVAIRAQLGFAL